MDWREVLTELERSGIPHVLVTVAEAAGSTPREAGAKMVVGPDQTWGSVGGGALEHHAMARARAMIGDRASTPVLEKDIRSADIGQVCGGSSTLLFEPFAASGSCLALFGAGHVGRALVRVLEDTGWRILWIDERPEAFPDPVPGHAEQRTADRPEELAPTLPAGCHALVMTHSHERDFAVLLALLQRNDLGSIGVIDRKSVV
jgi:xanthine dehydrogenase accessory factor